MTLAGPVADFSRTQRPDEQWLARALPEEPSPSEFPIIDAHMHMWHHATGYRYFVEEYARDIDSSGRRVEATIYIECGSFYRRGGPADMRSVGETEFAAGMAAIAASGKYTEAKIAAGIVASVDLLAEPGRLNELVDAHAEAANGRLRGIRMKAKWDSDPLVASGIVADRPKVLTEPAFHQGLRQIAARGLLYEASVFHPQISDVTAMARAVPDSSIVLIHTGSPLGYGGYRGRDREVHAAWLFSMRELATCSNVTIKLGGLLMSLGNFDFRTAGRPPTSDELAELWRPYIEPCIELFGAERCMVASNFPVERAGIPYPTLWSMYEKLMGGCSSHEASNLWNGTARRIYRL